MGCTYIYFINTNKKIWTLNFKKASIKFEHRIINLWIGLFTVNIFSMKFFCLVKLFWGKVDFNPWMFHLASAFHFPYEENPCIYLFPPSVLKDVAWATCRRGSSGESCRRQETGPGKLRSSTCPPSQPSVGRPLSASNLSSPLLTAPMCELVDLPCVHIRSL